MAASPILPIRLPSFTGPINRVYIRWNIGGGYVYQEDLPKVAFNDMSYARGMPYTEVSSGKVSSVETLSVKRTTVENVVVDMLSRGPLSAVRMPVTTQSSGGSLLKMFPVTVSTIATLSTKTSHAEGQCGRMSTTETTFIGLSPLEASPVGASLDGAAPVGTSHFGASPTGASPVGASSIRAPIVAVSVAQPYNRLPFVLTPIGITPTRTSPVSRSLLHTEYRPNITQQNTGTSVETSPLKARATKRARVPRFVTSLVKVSPPIAPRVTSTVSPQITSPLITSSVQAAQPMVTQVLVSPRVTSKISTPLATPHDRLPLLLPFPRRESTHVTSTTVAVAKVSSALPDAATSWRPQPGHPRPQVRRLLGSYPSGFRSRERFPSQHLPVARHLSGQSSGSPSEPHRSDPRPPASVASHLSAPSGDGSPESHRTEPHSSASMVRRRPGQSGDGPSKKHRSEPRSSVSVARRRSGDSESAPLEPHHSEARSSVHDSSSEYAPSSPKRQKR
ncbi:hypothetical protein E2C01_023317 [Portunus trituberculatus]|uniref:Uncharacterized protein n=1 Tax=Portunus trituberculatus TaxID=210409 RepID=A0A5B7E7P3_PORTR|nr:hypothetical protein [Portunus trituberculatus]